MLKQMGKWWEEDSENVLQLWLFCGATAATSVFGCKGRSGGIVTWLASVKQVSSKTSRWHVIHTCPPTLVWSRVKVTSNSSRIPMDRIPVQTFSYVVLNVTTEWTGMRSILEYNATFRSLLLKTLFIIVQRGESQTKTQISVKSSPYRPQILGEICFSEAIWIAPSLSLRFCVDKRVQNHEAKDLQLLLTPQAPFRATAHL